MIEVQNSVIGIHGKYTQGINNNYKVLNTEKITKNKVQRVNSETINHKIVSQKEV